MLKSRIVEDYSKDIHFDKTVDYIQFKQTFCNNFDFDHIKELAKSQQIRRTGSRITSWKVKSSIFI